jgi:tRNA dimethylallyltransferase
MGSARYSSIARERKPVLVAIVGPTAVGKSSAAAALAEHIDAEVVSADSRLLYRGMDIGTAKPSPEERRRVVHHLIDVTDVDQPWSLATYRHAALEAIEGIAGRGHLPLLVGGTGQYVTAILDGWEPPALPADPELRRRLEEEAAREGAPALHSRLARLDPASAERIDPRNVRRVIRALEIRMMTGKPASLQRGHRAPPFRALRLGLMLPRPELYERIDARIDSMLAAGWVDEVRALLDRGYSLDLPAFSALGYRPLAEVIRGQITLEDAKQRIRRSSREFVRRQANWFKPSDPRIEWVEVRPGVELELEARVRSWISGDRTDQARASRISE